MAQRKALRQLSIADYVAGVRGGDRPSWLGRSR